MKFRIASIPLTLTVLFAAATVATATPTEVLYLGDQTTERVQVGYSGTNAENLEYWFEENGITNPDGSAINPVADQLQQELFFTPEAREYEVEFLGIGRAGYHSPFGVFTYAGNPLADGFNPDDMTYQDPLFVQNEVDVNTTYNFSLDAGTYFGFYLDSNGRFAEKGHENALLSTVRAANKKATSNRVVNKGSYADGMDHSLFFVTNKGMTIAFEDIVGGGDADFEDLVINLSATDGSDFHPTPEPGTFALLGLGLLGIGCAARRQQQK
jgi:hypothetical protein